jgi:uncharacterized protein (TIGR02145 family)
MRRSTVVFILFLVAVLSVAAQDTVQVKVGWNLIGSVKAGAIPDILFTVPESLITSTYWVYTPGVGYRPADTLDNGVGYWVKANADGIVVFNNPPPIDSCKSQAFIYQGKLYHTVEIGDQCWMAENLDVGTMVTGLTEHTDNDTLEKYCYDNDPLNCTLYGGLYQWNEAMRYVTTPGAQGICPTGWHIPTLAEFETLSSTVGGVGNALKNIGQGAGEGAGTNTSGFSALLAGVRAFNGTFYLLGGSAFMRSSTEYYATVAHYMYLGYDNSYVDFRYSNDDYGYSVRCLKD